MADLGVGAGLALLASQVTGTHAAVHHMPTNNIQLDQAYVKQMHSHLIVVVWLNVIEGLSSEGQGFLSHKGGCCS